MWKFDWDTHIIAHVARHSVAPDEVEEAFARHNAVVPSDPGTGGEARWVLYGKTTAGRYLVVVFTKRGDRIRPVTPTQCTEPTGGGMARKSTKKPDAKMPEFKSEAVEADWYATAEGRQHTRRQFEKALRDGTIQRNPHGMPVKQTDPAILQELMEQAKAKATRLIGIRVPVLDLERAEAIAQQRGVGYQAVLKEAIREGLKKAG